MQPTEDERILAALSHASIVANVVNLAGMIATALIWTTQREKSRYVGAHALQSLVYQGIVLLIGILLMIFWGLCLFLSLLPAILRPDLFRSSPPNSFRLALIGLIVPLGFAGLATLYGLYGAFQVYRGRPFRYPLVGRLVGRELRPAIMAADPPPMAPAAAPPASPVIAEPASPHGIDDVPAAPPPGEPVAAPPTAEAPRVEEPAPTPDSTAQADARRQSRRRGSGEKE